MSNEIQEVQQIYLFVWEIKNGLKYNGLLDAEYKTLIIQWQNWKFKNWLQANWKMG